MIDRVDQATAQQAQLGLFAARASDPDKAAQAATIGQQLGVPQPVVEGNLPEWQQRAQLVANGAIVRSNPALGQWLVDNPLAPRIASDDFQNLDFLSRTAREWASGWSGATQSNALARLYYAGTAANPQLVAQLEDSLKQANADPAASGLVHGIAGMIAGFADMVERAAPVAAAGGIAGGALGAAAAGLPTAGVLTPIGAGAGAAVGAGAGFTAGIFSDAFKIGAGNIIHALSQVRDPKGNRVDPYVGLGAAVVGGLANAALNTFGFHFGASAASGAASALLNDAVAQAVTRPTVAGAISKFAVNLGKAGLTGSALGAAIEGSNILAEEAAKQLSTGNFDTIFNDPALRQQAVDRIADSAEQMALGLGVLHGLGGLPPLVADTLRARQAGDDMAAFAALQDGANASKVRSRSASLFQDWIARQTDGTPVENLFIPAARVAELYQSVGETPNSGDRLFGPIVPDIADQMRQGLPAGGDVVVPTAGFLTHLAGTDVARALQGDIRVRPDGMSLNEAQQFQNDYVAAIEARNADLRQQAEAESARVSSADQVAKEIRTQALAAGFGSDAAERYAQLYAARYATRGERLGEDPLDLFRNEGVQIERVPESGLTNTPPDQLDVLINALRQGGAGPSDAQLFGPSLLEYLAKRGGVEDVEGDLAAMGADAWHRGRPGTRRLVRPPREDAGAALPGMGAEAANEFTPDAAARAAWEEGYFPGAERPTVSEFYEAVRDELAGRKRYTEHASSKAAEFRGAVDDLDRTLNRLGIDPKSATNAEIRRALDHYAADGGGREFGQPQIGAPVASIRGDEIAPATADLPTLRQAAREFYERELRGTSVHSAALNRDVQFRSGRKSFSASAKPEKLQLFAALRDIIAKGELVSSEAHRMPPVNSSTKAYHYLEAPVELNGKRVKVGVTIREDHNGNLYYNHGIPDEAAAPPSAASEIKQGHAEGETDLQPAGDRLTKSGLVSEDGRATHDQNVVPPDDGVNIDVRELAKEGQPAEPGALGAEPQAEAAAAGEPVRRGSITLQDGRAVIRLFAKRDLSTLLHESGHLWLDELTRDAGRSDAPQQLRDDLAAVMRWLGVDSPDAIGTAEHEQFARGFEAYLMEGKAPSLALRGAFSRFKAWLLRIYRAVANLNAPIDPTIRGVFDRLLASDAEIERVRQQQGLGQLFRTADEAGMTDAEFRTYTAAVERARSEATDGLTQKVMGDVRRQRTAEWREQEAPIRDEVTRAVDARPDMRALRLLRTGKLDGAEGPAQRIRLDRQAIVDSFGSESALSLLPKRVPPIYTETGGMHPDFVAEMLGMRSGNDLLQALMTHEAQRQELLARGDTRSVRQFMIDDQTYARMVDRHGDVLQDGSIESDALDQVHGERQLEVLGTELRALGRRTGQQATPAAVARSWAARTIGDKLLKDGTRPAIFLRAEAKAGNAAMRAVLAGDHAEAFRQKQAQLLNHALYMEAKAARDDVQAGMARMERFGAKAEFPTIAAGYVDRIHDLLRRFQMPTKRNDAELDRALGKVTLQAWATDRIADGHEIYIAPDLYDGTYAKPVDQLTVAQFRDLADTIKSIAHVGRAESDVIVGREKADRAETIEQMVDAARALPQRPPQDFVNQGGRVGASGLAERAAAGVGAFHAMLLKPEAIIDRLDGDNSNGVFNKAIWRPIKAAQAAENELRTEVAGRLRALRELTGKDYGKDFDRTLPTIPELIDQRTGEPMALKRRGLVAIALNVGNESNLDRLLKGYGWTAEGVQAALDRHMTAADWQYVQGIWDTFESLFPRIEAMQRRMTGVGLEKIEPREVETPFGKMRGGYYPVVYDPNLSLLGDRIRASGEQRFEPDYVRATTPKGHTIARVDSVSEPLSLDPDLIHWKLGQAVHDLAYREAIVNADKLLRDKRVMAAIDGALGRDQRKQLDRWLQGVANDRNIDTRGLAAMDSFLHRLRTNTMVVGIGFRATTMLKHGITALSNSVGELGPAWLLRGSAEYFGSWDKMTRNYEMITSKSAEMKFRMDSIDRDVREALQDLHGKSGFVSDAVRFSHYGVAALDMLSALPTWLGAYRKAEAEGMEEADAVAFADKTVRNAHGANGAPDMAAIQRGSEAQKLFTMFYGFFNHIYNRQVVGARAAVDAGRNVVAGNFAGARRDFAKALSTFFFYLAVPALIEGLVSQGGPGNDDDWLSWGAKQVAGEVPAGVPVLRDLAKAVITGRDYEMSPVAKAAQTVIDSGKDVASLVGAREKEPSSRWLQHAIESAGYILGLPTGQAAGTVQFLKDVGAGTEDPQSVQDWLRGLMYGPPPKHAAGG